MGEPLNLERGTVNFLEHFEPCFKYRAQEVVDVASSWVELDDGDAPFHIKIDAIGSGNGSKGLPQSRQVVPLQVFN